MTRILTPLMVFGICLGLAGWITAQDGETSGRPLDLPSGGAGADDDEDAPESITFYGAEYEAEGFFWCLDRSGSMEGQPIATLKAEMVDALGQLSARSQFGLVHFGTGFEQWNGGRPAKASGPMKASGIEFITSMIAFGWTCMPDPVAEICNIANRCRLRNKAIILVGDGMPYCGSLSNLLTNETLASLATANYRRIPVNTIFISADEAGINFFRNIASLYRGKFTAVN